VGGRAIGQTFGQLAFDIEEVPSRELLFTKIDNLGVQDVVSFGNNSFHLASHSAPRLCYLGSMPILAAQSALKT